MNKYQSFVAADTQIPEKQLAWPLFGTGVEFLGKNGKPVEQSVPAYSENEILMRLDAVSMCFTDVKEITQGENHPRLADRNLKENPIIPGHEVSMTVVGVGKNLSEAYKVGDRFTIQPDVWVNGKSIPFCFGMHGGYRQYAKIGREILEGDAGNYLIPISKDMLYAAAAITEPWACVEAAYRAAYRDQMREGGAVWIIGGSGVREGYQPEALFGRSVPVTVQVTNVPEDLKEKIFSICQTKNIGCLEKSIENVFEDEATFDDIIALDCDGETIKRTSTKLGKGGMLVIFADAEVSKIDIDLGRIHYDDIYYAGSNSLDLNVGYIGTAPRADLLAGGRTWIVGAGGPMGRMHLQRAIESQKGPSLIVASEVTVDRYESLKEFFYPMAEEHGKELIIVNPKDEPHESEVVMQRVLNEGGFDDIEIMITIVPIVADTVKYAAKGSVISMFAGLKRGVMMTIDPSVFYGPQQVRFIGHSGSALDDQQAVVSKMLSGELKPELSVAAVGGLMQIGEGIMAMEDWKYPGKIVIYPHVIDFPLTGLHEFKEKDPQIYAALGSGETWTKQAEELFLEKELN